MIELFSEQDREEKLIQLLGAEPLFVALQESMDKYDNHLEKHTTKVENWVDAKDFIATLFKCPVPAAMVSHAYKKLNDNSSAISSNYRGQEYGIDIVNNLNKYKQGYEVGIVLTYSLIIALYLLRTRKEQKYQEVFAKLKRLCNETGVVYREYLAEMDLCMADGIENGSIPDVYDYTKPDRICVDASGDSEEDKYPSEGELQLKIKTLEAENEKLKHEVEMQKGEKPEESATEPISDENTNLRTELTAAAVVIAVDQYKYSSTERKKYLLSAISGLRPTTFSNVIGVLTEKQKKLAEKRLEETINKIEVSKS